MPLTEIRKRIEEESKKQIKALQEQTLKEKEEILAAAKERAKQILKSSDEEISSEIDRLTLEQSASTEILAREIELQARESALQAEIGASKEELLKALMEDKRLYKGIFTSAVKEAAALGPIREFTIITNKKDAELLGKNGATVQYQNLRGGLIIQSHDKNIRIDATIDNMVDSRTEDIRSTLLENMFTQKKESHKVAHPEKKQTHHKQKKEKPAKKKARRKR